MKRLLLALSLPLYVIDQITKEIVLRTIAEHEAIPVIPGWFFLVQWHNTGAAFSLLSNNNLFFVALSAVAILVLAVLIWRGTFRDTPSRLGAALLAAGVLGNLTDRLRHGHVIDFLLVDLHVWPANPWPAFNVADACICTAAGLFLIHSLLEAKRQPQPVIAP